MHTLVKTLSLVDGTGAAPMAGGCLLIKNGTIEDVRPAGKFGRLGPDVQVIDLSDRHVMPGLINAHTHLSIVPGDGNQSGQMRLPPQLNVLRSTPNILKDIRSGVTTQRIMGEEGGIDVDFKRAISEGLINGPRMVISTQGIAAANSHGVGPRPSDGVDQMRKHVRQNLAAGADFIKIFATGGTSSPGKVLHSCPYTPEEIAMAVSEAERAGTYVAAHAHGGTGLDYCIDNGVRTIEHGAFINEDQLERIIKRGVWIVGTMSIMCHPEGIEKSDFHIPTIKEKVLMAREALSQTFARVLASGANLSLGTDSVHGMMHFEMEKLVEFGATPMQAIVCVTRNAARVCRLEDKIGTLEPGRYADFIALEKNPLDDIRNMRTVNAVYKEGRLFQGI
jgi:imidazolonepropionase-like amidohydrolase